MEDIRASGLRLGLDLCTDRISGLAVVSEVTLSVHNSMRYRGRYDSTRIRRGKFVDEEGDATDQDRCTWSEVPYL